MFSWFRDSSGAIYWPSTLTFIGWALSGIIMFVGFSISRKDRDRSSQEKEGLSKEIALAKADARIARLPRSLTSEQRAKLVKELSKTPANWKACYFTYAFVDGEAEQYCKELKEAFESAGYQTNMGSYTGTGVGLYLPLLRRLRTQ